MKLKRTTARLIMLLGSLVYLIGIWRTCPLFSGKGYFLGVLVMGMFAVLTHVPAGSVAIGSIAAGRCLVCSGAVARKKYLRDGMVCLYVRCVSNVLSR